MRGVFGQGAFSAQAIGESPFPRRISSTAAWTPLQLSPSGWWKSDTGVTVSGSDVTSWTDQSGNGRTLTGTATRLPTRVSTTVGTYATNVVNFDGGSLQQMTLSVSVPTNGSVITVARVTLAGAAGHAPLMWDATGTTTVPGVEFEHPTSSRPAIILNSAAQNPGPASLIDSTWHAARWMWGASNFSYARDNAANTTAARGGLTASGTWTQVGTVLNTTLYTTFRLAELIIVPSELTAGQITSLNSYLSTRYGLW